MPRQMKKSEQLNSCMSLVLDYDEPLTRKKDLLSAFRKALGDNVSIFYKELINEFQNYQNSTINILGVYHYDNMEIYCDFNIDDYINRKMHSSSAHIYLNDLYQGMKNGIFVKKDANSNKISVIKGINLKDFLKGDIISKDPIIDEFIEKNNYSSIVLYTGNKNKREGLLDFDLFFPFLNFYGDYIAYISKMKHSVNFKRMFIFELNQINMHTILSDFNQGHNSGPSAADRAAKFLLNKENLNNSIIYTYERSTDEN